VTNLTVCCCCFVFLLLLLKADCYVALPGGIGTMEELLEMMTWQQLGLHRKPVGLYNVNGYYDLYLEWVGVSVALVLSSLSLSFL